VDPDRSALLLRSDPARGEDGFLLAGARSVVSTLWSIDDTFSSFLMKQFYGHLATGAAPTLALAAAKRDMVSKYGRSALPYYWAALTIEGAADRATPAAAQK
jgi:CHAT domain-containing protein